MEDLKNNIPNPYFFQMVSKSKKLETSNFTITKDWEVNDENLESFDLFNNDLSIDINSEINKYQGLMSFAKYVEQNEKQTNNPAWMLSLFKSNFPANSFNSPFRQKINKNLSQPNFQSIIEEEKQGKQSPNSTTMNRSHFYKASNFNITFPPRFLTRRNSDEIKNFSNYAVQSPKKNQKTNFKRKLSDQNLSTFNNLVFLDKYIHEYISSNDFNETKAENLRKIKLKIQEIFKNEQEETENFMYSSSNQMNSNLIKPRKFGPWGEMWEDRKRIIAKTSPYGHFPSYQLRTMIVKGGDDLRQELIAMQIIKQIHKIFKKAELNLFLRPYDIIVTSANSGIIGIFS